MASNLALEIGDPNTTEHPVVIVTAKPLLVVHGSSSHPFDLDSVVETVESKDLVADPRGKGLTTATRFDVCRTMAIKHGDLTRYLGRLKPDVLDRLIDAQRQCP